MPNNIIPIKDPQQPDYQMLMIPPSSWDALPEGANNTEIWWAIMQLAEKAGAPVSCNLETEETTINEGVEWGWDEDTNEFLMRWKIPSENASHVVTPGSG